ncbi:MAG: hypothetical protein JO102_01205 [Elusimicrobia bacterium]|nr:hypothetical protein [Elusimicrobiota bacterium]
MPHFELESHERFRAALLLSLAAVIGLYFRVVNFPHVGVDLHKWFIPWLQHLKSTGGFTGIATSPADYSAAYLYLLAVGSYFNFREVYVIKSITLCFELVAAVAAFRIVERCTGLISRGALAAAGLFLLPTVIVNGSFWGQCDIIYSSFALLAVDQLLAGRDNWAMACVGMAFAFKLQAILIGPFVLLLVCSRRIALWQPLIAVAVWLLAAVPAVLLGRSFANSIAYWGQIHEYSKITMNLPNLYEWFHPRPRFVPDLEQFALGATVVAVILMAALVAWRRPPVTHRRILEFAFVPAVICPYLLPKMHERYMFLADVLTAVYAFVAPSRCLLAIGMQYASSMSYRAFLFKHYGEPYERATLVLGLVAAGSVVVFLTGVFLPFDGGPDGKSSEK